MENFCVIFLVECGEMGALTNFFLARSAEIFEKVTVKGGSVFCLLLGLRFRKKHNAIIIRKYYYLFSFGDLLVSFFNMILS